MRRDVTSLLNPAMELPPGLSARPLTPDDLDAVFAVFAAEELGDIGEVLIEREDIVCDWQRPSFDLASSSIGVYDGDRLVAVGQITFRDRCDAAVLPSHRGRGIGTWLAGWIQDTARSQGSTVIGMPVPQGSPGDHLLAELGYRVRWTSWVLRVPDGQVVEAQPLPSGYSLRQVREDEHQVVWEVVEDAFLEWSVRERQSFEDFAASVFRRPGYDPWQLRVAADPAGEVVGVAYVLVSGDNSYIEKLAVRRDQRNRGLARALLADAFAAGREHGGPRAELSTDSRTGALSLYEKLGMVVTNTWVNRAIML